MGSTITGECISFFLCVRPYRTHYINCYVQGNAMAFKICIFDYVSNINLPQGLTFSEVYLQMN